ISVRYAFDKASVDIAQPIPFFTTDSRTRTQSVVGEHKWLLSSTLINSAKVAWNQAYESTDNVANVAIDPNLFFVPGTRFGTIAISGLTSLGPDTSTPTFVDLESVQVIDNLSWVRGGHNLKAGFSLTRYINDQSSSFDYGGLYNFTSLEN